MCVLHVTSESASFAGFLKETTFPIYQSHEKGDVKSAVRAQPWSDYGFSAVVSDRAWSDLAGQIEDAHAFLREHDAVLRKLISTHAIADIRLDFPYSCRLGERIFMQCNYLPPDFMRLAGELGIGIELSHYPPSNEEADGP